MVLLGDEAQMEDRFGLFGDSVSFYLRYLHGLRQMYHSLRKRFGRTGWYSIVTGLKSKLVSVRLETVLILTQDRARFAPTVP
jgi:hypothetical protein